MGCASSTPTDDDKDGGGAASSASPRTSKKLRQPKPWKHPTPLTRAELARMRDEFWDTAPHYGGQREIWDALKAATEADIGLAQLIVESAAIIVADPAGTLALCYDERGASLDDMTVAYPFCLLPFKGEELLLLHAASPSCSFSEEPSPFTPHAAEDTFEGVRDGACDPRNASPGHLSAEKQFMFSGEATSASGHLAVCGRPADHTGTNCDAHDKMVTRAMV